MAVIVRFLRNIGCSVVGSPWPTTHGVRSDFLVAQPSCLTGAARILDLYGVFDEYNQSPTVQEADARALACDWKVIGQDLLTTAYHLYPEHSASISREQQESR